MKRIGFLSLVGRLLFVSPFLVSFCRLYNIFVRHNKSGVDGDAAANDLLTPLLTTIQNFLTSTYGEWTRNKIDAKFIVALSFTLKSAGSSTFLVLPWFGALLFLFDMVFLTPLFSDFDFYNYDFGGPIFWELLQKFTQHISFCVVLLFVFWMNFKMTMLKPIQCKPKTKLGTKKKLIAKIE